MASAEADPRLSRALQIHKLFELLVYVRENEETACVKIVHCYRKTEDIPSELEPNCKSECRAMARNTNAD